MINRGLISSGLAPVVIPVDDRATYMKLLACSDYDGMADMLRTLSEAEAARMEGFAEIGKTNFSYDVRVGSSQKVEAFDNEKDAMRFANDLALKAL